MNKLKILFSIQSYPSENSANGLCDEKLIEELMKSNIYEIHVLCYRYNFQPKYEIVNGVIVHRFSKGVWWNIYTWARHQKKSWVTQIIFLMDRVILRFKQFITIPIYPHTNWFISWLGYVYASKLQKKYKFDIVVTEHNALATTITGYLLKKKFPEIQFMPIFWDALSGGFKVKYLPVRFSQYRKERLELKIFKRADKIIAMESHNKHLQKTMKNNYMLNKIVFLNIPYFIEQDDKFLKKEDIVLPTECKYIIFAGNLWQRNPEYFIKVLAKCELTNVTLLVISASKKSVYMKQLAYKYNINIQYLDFLQHDKLINVLKQASFLLNFGVTNSNAISGKIFEYMGFGKPIISTYSIDNEACIPFLKKYPLSFLLDEREQNIEKQAIALRKFIEDNLDKKVSYEEIAPIFYKNTPKSYVREINKLITKKQI